MAARKKRPTTRKRKSLPANIRQPWENPNISRGTDPASFLLQTLKVQKKLQEAYMDSITLKGMYDRWEFIEGSDRVAYNANNTIADKLGPLIDKAYNNYMRLRKELALGDFR